MPFTKTPFKNLLIFEPKILKDDRGYFFESYNANTFEAEGLHYNFLQDNQAQSTYGVIRGLHYQLAPHAQTKLVRCILGSILDVVVDLREGSPTFGKSFSIELSVDNKKQLLVPQGFAHGYSVLSPIAEIMYKCDAFYNNKTEAGILYNDPTLKIDWQIPKGEEIISAKDLAQPTLKNCKHNFTFNG